jgi:predicted permease
MRIGPSSAGFDAWWLDIKLGVRILLKYPGLALVGVFGIAVAVAIAVGGFSIIYSNFLAPSLPLEEGDRVVAIQLWDAAANRPEPRILRDYQVWRKELKSIQEIGAFRTVAVNLIAPGVPPESVLVASMSASGFRLARVRPLMGRYLEDEDEREGAPSVVVVGEDVWRDRLGSDPAILGKSIQLGGARFSVVGVMPESFAFPINHHIWVPLRLSTGLPEPLTGPELLVFGRLATGSSLKSAQVELAASGQNAAVAFPRIYAQLRPQVKRYASPLGDSNNNGGAADLAAILMMNLPAAMVLVLVCLNVAILVYTRTAMRQAEISVRTALGASRSRIVGQLFIEALVLSSAGTIAGVVIAAVVLRYVAGVTRQVVAELPFWVSLRISPQAVLYAGVLSVLAAAIVGIVPALKATRRTIQNEARAAGVESSGMRLGRTWTALVIAQVALAVALLPAAVFNAWNEVRLEFVDPGFPAAEFLTAQLGMDDIQRAAQASPETQEFERRYADRQTELIRRLKAEPQISGVTFGMAIPGAEPSASIDLQSTTHPIRFNRVDVDFFRTLDVPILAGRGFESSDVTPAGDNATEPRESSVVVVNQSLALRLFGGNALGQRIRYAQGGGAAAQDAGPGRWYEIVGIVSDFPAGVSPGMLDSPLKLYHPVRAGQVLPATLAVRVRGAAAATFAPSLSKITADVDPDLHLRSMRTLQEALHREQWIRRLEAFMLGAVSLSVLLLSSAGIYALMSFAVSQRRKEIGIRVALGANPRRVIASIFSRAIGQLALGVLLGVIAATALESANHFLQGNAAVILTIMALFMMAVGLIAALGPARLCLRIEPNDALREQ